MYIHIMYKKFHFLFFRSREKVTWLTPRLQSCSKSRKIWEYPRVCYIYGFFTSYPYFWRTKLWIRRLKFRWIQRIGDSYQSSIYDMCERLIRGVKISLFNRGQNGILSARVYFAVFYGGSMSTIWATCESLNLLWIYVNLHVLYLCFIARRATISLSYFQFSCRWPAK